MATQTQSRTRAGRIGGAGPTSNSTSIPASVVSTANTTKPLQYALPQGPAGATSALHIFLTNLKLLDFDLLPDWPEISVSTFHGVGNNAQGQKKRIQCVEWSLYHLCSLWDPEETANVSFPHYFDSTILQY